MSQKKRIYQLLAESGIIKSKKEAVQLARSGKIKVDGKEIQSLHYQINPKRRKLTANEIEVKPLQKKYFILNKPKGIETTKENIIKLAENKKIASKELLSSLYPIGRLDKETTGLIIITNEGKLGNRILNPKREIKKIYLVKTQRKINDGDAEKIRKGVTINLEENGIITKYKTKPAEILIKND